MRFQFASHSRDAAPQILRIGVELDRAGRFSASSAAIAAISSMRLLVVFGLAALDLLARGHPQTRIAPQPPGPGLPEQAPSVKITTLPLIADQGHIRRASRTRVVEAQLAQIFERVLGLHQRARRHVQPVDEPRQQEAQRRAAGQQRQRRDLRRRQAAHVAA